MGASRQAICRACSCARAPRPKRYSSPAPSERHLNQEVTRQKHHCFGTALFRCRLRTVSILRLKVEMDEQAMHDRRWWALAVMCLSLLTISLDNTILNIAIPALVKHLNASTSQLQWILDGYILVFAGLLLTTGSLGDRFGRRGALSAGLAIFGGGSLASAFAGSAAQLIVTRAFMGIGAA